MLFLDDLSQESLLYESRNNQDEWEEDRDIQQVEARHHVTYNRQEKDQGVEKGYQNSKGGGVRQEGGGTDSPGSSGPLPESSSNCTTYCSHAEPTTAFYAILGLSRCWWQCTVTSCDAMNEGVATEIRGGPRNSAPEVTEVGWPLPCSLSSLLAMNCRARAEELARRLQSRVKVGAGANSTLEHTSLVAPSAFEGPYSSMECRHSSLDEPNLDDLEEHNLRPIHVVTSEPTLHLRLPTPPPIDKHTEQDSDVYYDFDLASPDDIPVDIERQEDHGKRRSIGEKPESGCVTSVTSPLMFDEDGDDDEGDQVSRDLCVPQESVSCSPEADLRAVRKILSSTSLTEKSSVCPEQLDSDERFSVENEKRFSLASSAWDDAKSSDKIAAVEGGEINVCDKRSVSASMAVSDSSDCEEVSTERGPLTNGHSAPPEGATEDVDKCLEEEGHHKYHHHKICSGQVEMPVANSSSCWCHTALGREPNLNHLPISPSSEGTTVIKQNYSEFEALEDYTDGGSLEDNTSDTPVMKAEDTGRVEEKRVYNSLPLTKQDKESVTKVPGLSPSTLKRNLEVKLESNISPSVVSSQSSLTEEEEEEEEGVEEIEETNISPESCVQVPSVAAPATISGTSPPLPTEDHLYVSSEEHPAAAAAVAEMEARSGSEADLHAREETSGIDSDNEVIETLGEDDEDEEENEEDIEEEVILTGKFCNFRQYTERVRRLSDEIEDQHPPTTVITKEDVEEISDIESSKSINFADDDRVSCSDLASQLSQLDVEGDEVLEDEGSNEIDDDETPRESRSSSEEADPSRIEDFKMRIKRSSSLKCGKTPPGTPGRKKIVRFADVLGLDLAAVKTFLKGVPHVPRSAFWDLEVEKEAANANAESTTGGANGSGITYVPRRVLTPLFQQPGAHHGFLDRVRNYKVVVENVIIGDDMSVRGIVRVLSMDFNKTVVVRYTFDQWRNYHEATATYVPNSHDGLTDRFSFLLWGSFLQDNGALAFCVRYNTLGQEYWDNNYGRNYTLQCYTSMAPIGGDTGSSSPRPQNSSNVQHHMVMGHASGGGPSSQQYSSFGSPVTPNDPWVTRFF